VADVEEVVGVENFDLLVSSEFRELHGFTIPAWLVNCERRMGFNFEGCEDAEHAWLEKVIHEQVMPGHFAFYFGPGTEMDEHLCRAILVRLSMYELKADLLSVETPKNRENRGRSIRQPENL
jgi:hypothetical protein